MSDFLLRLYCSEHKAIWDEAVRNSRNGTFLHLRDYMDYHAHRFDEQSLIVEHKGRAVAVFPANRSGEAIISHGGLTYGGLIYGMELHAAEVLEIMRLLAAHYAGLGARLLRYKAIPHIFHRYPAEEDLYALFRLDARLARRDLSSVIVPEDRPRLSDSRKCTIRKAVKSDVEVSEGNSLAAFHVLLSEALARHGAQPVHTLAELELLKSRFPQQIRLFGAFRAERLLAATLVYDFGRVAHTQYLASSEEGRTLGALDFLLADLLGNAFANRRYFSFGISTEHEGRELNAGLIFQKEGFGGRGIVHDFYELEL